MKLLLKEQAFLCINHIWRFFISLRLTFVLLVLIAVGAVVGMFFDQTLSFDEFYSQLPQDSLSGLFLSYFELYDAFHSWWFSLAIMLLALNLIACSIERLPRIYLDFMNPRPYLTPRRMLGLSLKEEITAATKDQAEAIVSQFLAANLQQASLPKASGHFYHERHRLGRFGVYVVHIALLIIMFSSIYATQNGVSGLVLVEEGRKARFITAKGTSGVTYTYDLGFYVGCDDFRLQSFVDNSPMEFESDLYISVAANHQLIKKTVRVNEPLSYAGFTFYQSSYQPIVSEPIVEIEIADASGYKKRHRIRLNTPIILPSGESLVVEKIYEDFAGLGQALRLAKKTDQGESTYFHIFRRHNDYDRLVRADHFYVTFVNVDQHYATGLSVGKVPGITIIFLGFLLLLVGLYMCFFMTPIRFMARIFEKEGVFIVWLSALGFRNHQLVKDIFAKKLSQIRLMNEKSHA